MKFKSKTMLATAALLVLYSSPGWAEHDIQPIQPQIQEEISRLELNIEKNDLDIKSINDLGVIYLKLREFDKAITQFKKALETDPSYSMGPFLFGDIYTDAEHYQEKIDEFKKVINRNHEYARAHNYLGLAYLQQKNYSTAETSLLESIKINPKYAKAHNNLGVLYEELGETGKAIESYKIATRIDPDDPDSHFNLALAYDSLGDGENSVRHMVLAKKAHERKPGNEEIDRFSEKLDQLWAKYADTKEITSVASLDSKLTSDAGSPANISTNPTSEVSTYPSFTPLDRPQTSKITDSGIASEDSKEMTVTLKPHWDVSKDTTDPAPQPNTIEEETFTVDPVKEAKAEKKDDSRTVSVLPDREELTAKTNVMDKGFTGSRGTYEYPGSSSNPEENVETPPSSKPQKKLVAKKPEKKTWVSDWVFEYPK